jgi:hypothetical protein
LLPETVPSSSDRRTLHLKILAHLLGYDVFEARVKIHGMGIPSEGKNDDDTVPGLYKDPAGAKILDNNKVVLVDGKVELLGLLEELPLGGLGRPIQNQSPGTGFHLLIEHLAVNPGQSNTEPGYHSVGDDEEDEDGFQTLPVHGENLAEKGGREKRVEAAGRIKWVGQRSD